MTNTPNEEPRDLFSILEAEARAVAAAFGVSTANELAAALIDRVHHRLHTDRVRVVKRSRLRRQEVHEAMRRDFNGANTQEVADRYGYSRAQAYRILTKK